MKPVFSLESCVVRPWRREYAGPVARWADNPRIARFMRDRFPSPYTIRDARRWIRAANGTEPVRHFAIEVDGEAAGGIGFDPYEDVDRRTAEIGYWLAEPHWGHAVAWDPNGDLVVRVRGDETRIVVEGLAGYLGTLHDRVVPEPDRARFARFTADLLHPLGERTQPRRKPRGHGRHRDAGPAERLDRGLDHGVVHADCGHADVQRRRAEALEEVEPHGLARLGAQPAHSARRVVTGKGGEVDTGDCAEQPGDLPVFLDRAPARQRRGAPLDGAPVDPDFPDPGKVQKHPRVPDRVLGRLWRVNRPGRRRSVASGAGCRGHWS